MNFKIYSNLVRLGTNKPIGRSQMSFQEAKHIPAEFEYLWALKYTTRYYIQKRIMIIK